MTTSTLVELSSSPVASFRGNSRWQVAVSELVIYVFGDDGVGDLSYWKSVDGGLTWSAPTSVMGFGASTAQWMDIYYERWNGQSRPNIVHLVQDNDSGSRGIWYNSLDLDSDTLGTKVLAVPMGPHPTERCGGIGVARDGTIRVDSRTFLGTVSGAYSIDGGASWVSTGNSLCEAEFDRMTMWADFAGDTDDIAAIFWDVSANEYSIKRWDKSANTITETAIGTVTDYGGHTSALNPSNGHIYVAAFDQSGTGARDLQTWDVYGATVTARGDVLTATSWGAESVALAILETGAVRCYYARDAGAASLASVEIYYKESSNAMVSWGAEQLYSSVSLELYGLHLDPVPIGAVAPAYDDATRIWIEAPAPTSAPEQFRLMLSDGADPDVPNLNVTGSNIPGSPLIRVERGRESAVLGMPARAGQATARLDNVALPYGLDEPTPGLALRLNKRYDGAWYHLWQGNLDIPEHAMAGVRPTVSVRALGPLTKLANRKGSTSLYQNITTGAAIGHLLDAVGFPSALRDLDAGDVTLPYWWMNDEDALSALWTIVNSEGITAELYEGGDGKLVFRSRSARYTETRSTAIQSTFRNAGAAPWLNAFDYTAGYREVINYAEHDRYRRTNDTAPSVVWDDTPDFYYIVPPNGSITVLATATEPFFDAITPIASTDFVYGFDNPTVTLERTSGQRTKITFTSGVNGTTLTGLQLRATTTINNATYTEVSTVDNTASVAAYGLRPWGGSMSKELDWATMRDNLDAIVTWKQEPRGRVRFSFNAAQSAAANEATAKRDLGDRVRVIESNLDFDGELWIERMEHEINAPAGPADGSAVGSEVTTYECSVITVAGGSSGSGVGETAPYPNNAVYVGTSIDDDGITMRGASIF